MTCTGLFGCGRTASRGKRATGTFSYTARFESHVGRDNQKHRPHLTAEPMFLVTRTGLFGCGRTASRGKRATGTFSYAARFESRVGRNNQKHRPHLTAEPMFLVTRTGLEPMLPP